MFKKWQKLLKEELYKKKNLFVYVPEGIDLQQPYTIWLYFHGNWDQPGKEPYWGKMKKAADGARAVFVSSYLGVKPKGAPDSNIINNAISLIQANRGKIAEPNKINAYGFSAGGGTMSNFILNGGGGEITKFMFLDGIYPRWWKQAVRAIQSVGPEKVTIVWRPRGDTAKATKRVIKKFDGIKTSTFAGEHGNARFIRESVSKNKNNIFENWKKYLKETKNHWELEILFTLEKDTSTYDIFQRIRALPGITIVKSTSKMVKPENSTNKMIALSIKAIVHPYNLQSYVTNLNSTLKKIKDDEGDRVLDIKIMRAPQKTEIE